jgi:hypothetical protein
VKGVLTKPTKVAEEMRVFLVRPATLEGISVQPKKSDRIKGTVMRYMPHLDHLLLGVFGRLSSC